MKTETLWSSKNENWATPQELYDKLDAEFHFNLDPCADDENHKCDRYFTKEQDGLQQNWGGCRVFCNPPYGRQIVKWVRKAWEETRKENTLVVMLLHARTDTRWFQDYVYHRTEIRFISGRVRFGGAENNAPFPSMVVIFRSPGVK